MLAALTEDLFLFQQNFFFSHTIYYSHNGLTALFVYVGKVSPFVFPQKH